MNTKIEIAHWIVTFFIMIGYLLLLSYGVWLTSKYKGDEE